MTLTITPRERKLIEMCVHEASHSLAGVALNGILRRAAVSGGVRFGTISGSTVFDDLPVGRDAAVAYAAAFGQARWRHGRRPTQAEVYAVLDSTGREDYAVLSAAGGIGSGVGVTPLIERCWGSVAKLAAQLYREATVRHVDVLDALGLTEQTAPMGLSLIRSGCAPGTFTVTLAA